MTIIARPGETRRREGVGIADRDCWATITLVDTFLIFIDYKDCGFYLLKLRDLWLLVCVVQSDNSHGECSVHLYKVQARRLEGGRTTSGSAAVLDLAGWLAGWLVTAGWLCDWLDLPGRLARQCPASKLLAWYRTRTRGDRSAVLHYYITRLYHSIGTSEDATIFTCRLQTSADTCRHLQDMQGLRASLALIFRA